MLFQSFCTLTSAHTSGCSTCVSVKPIAAQAVAKTRKGERRERYMPQLATWVSAQFQHFNHSRTIKLNRLKPKQQIRGTALNHSLAQLLLLFVEYPTLGTVYYKRRGHTKNNLLTVIRVATVPYRTALSQLQGQSCLKRVLAFSFLSTSNEGDYSARFHIGSAHAVNIPIARKVHDKTTSSLSFHF